MAEDSRGKQMVRLAIRQRYHVAKLLDINTFVTVSENDVLPRSETDFDIVSYSGRHHQAILFDTGDYIQMEIIRQNLEEYEQKFEQCRRLRSTNQNVQTEIESTELDVDITGETNVDNEFSKELSKENINEPMVQLPVEYVGQEEDFTNKTIEEYQFDNSIISITDDDIQAIPGPSYGKPEPTFVHIRTEGEVLAVNPPNLKELEVVVEPEASGEPTVVSRAEDLIMQKEAMQEGEVPDVNPPNIKEMEVVVEPEASGEPTVVARAEDLILQRESMQENQEERIGKRTRNRQFCIFCKKVITQLPRHLLVKHQEEDRVREFSALPLKDKTRSLLIANIRREGNAAYNALLTEQGKSVIPLRKSKERDYYPCPHCGAFFSKKTLARHYGACSGKKVPKNFQSILFCQKKIKSTTTSISEKLKKEILTGMRAKDDEQAEVLKVITTDSDIIEFGNSQCKKYAAEINLNRNQIRRKLRLLANLSLQIRKHDPTVNCIADVFFPEKWNLFIIVVQTISGFDEDTCSFKSPNVVGELGMLISSIARDIKAKTPMTDVGKEIRERIQAWIELFERAYNTTIGSQAAKAAMKKKWIKRNYQPVAKDIVTLNNYLKDLLQKSLAELEEGFSILSWENVNTAAMLLLLTFNRKRIGEVQNITVQDFNRKSKIQTNTDIYRGLTPSEKMIADRFYHVMIRGKLARGVPVLIEEGLAAAIEKIIDLRPVAKVDKDNPYLFGKGSTGFFNGSQAMKEAAYNCGAKEPELLTSSRLRKHVASVSQALNLTDNDLKVLSGFLGHTTHTHLEHYRLPSDAVHTARLSRLLMALDQGNISQFQGKTISEIDVNIPIHDLEEEEVDNPLPVNDSTTVGQRQARTPSPPTTPSKRTSTAISKKSKQMSTPSPHKTQTGKLIVTPSPPKRKRIRWSTPEKRAMKTAFAHHLTNKTLPSFTECKEVRMTVKELASRRVTLLKAWVNNEIRRRAKQE